MRGLNRPQMIESASAPLNEATAEDFVLPSHKPSFFNIAVAKSITGAVLASGLLWPGLAYSLGVGGVETRSYIGQPLRVEVPLYNVESPNTLEITLELIGEEDSGGLTATLSRANSQLSVLIRSIEAVNEPYFNFSLNLVDEGNEFRKQFTVLLDLSPTGNPHYVEPRPQAQAQATALGSPDVRAYDVDSSANNTLSSNSSSTSSSSTRSSSGVSRGVSGSVMGPYDWAKANQIPEKFGAVLDGQSLWRVARRISPAMNASNNQMMWALYQANPQAFSSKNIESLRAGVFLTIPSVATVNRIPDREAKRLLDNLSSSLPSSQQVVNADGSTEAEVAAPIVDLTDASPDNASSPVNADGSVGGQFQLSGLESKVNAAGSLVSASDEQSKEIISSLSETISSMTEQLGRKDKQIEVLEAQVVELKTFIQSEGASVPETRLSSNELLSSPAPSISDVELGSQNSAQSVVEPVEVATGNVALNSVSAAADQQATIEGSSAWYLWVLAVLGSLALLGFAMRNRLTRLWTSLNFGGANDELAFQPTVFNEALGQELAKKEHSHHTMTVSQNTSFSDSEYNEPFSEPFTEIESEIFVDEVTPEDELDFEQRFARLLAEGDFEFARQLLDIAHGHDVNDERYHYYRLQLLALNYDEDAFYDYYYSIENDIPNFTNLVQTDISKLVVRLAKH